MACNAQMESGSLDLGGRVDHQPPDAPALDILAQQHRNRIRFQVVRGQHQRVLDDHVRRRMEEVTD